MKTAMVRVEGAEVRPVFDPFVSYNELVRRAGRAYLLALLFAGCAVLALCTAFLSFTRPLPVVVSSDDASVPRRIVNAQDAAVREVDAKRFFAKMTGMLVSWDSLSVSDELSAATMLMTTRWRKAFVAELSKEVKVPSTVLASGKAPLLQSYVLASVKNEASLDWDDVACSKAEGAWHCKGSASLVTMPLFVSRADGDVGATLRRELTIHASFVEVPVTTASIDGLLVDFYDVQVAK